MLRINYECLQRLQHIPEVFDLVIQIVNTLPHRQGHQRQYPRRKASPQR